MQNPYQWNPGPARKNPTHILAAACGRFHAVILQEASDHAPRVSDKFIAYTGGTDLAILARRRCLRHLRGLFQQGHVEDGGIGRSWTVHVHNVVAKKRNASTSLLQRLRDQTAHFPVYLHLRSTNLPGRDSITRSANGSASNLRSKQHHDLPVPSIRNNITGHMLKRLAFAPVRPNTLSECE